MPLVVLDGVSDHRNTHYHDKWHNTRLGVDRRDYWNRLQNRNHEKVEIGKAPELIKQRQRQKIQQGVVRGTDIVTAVPHCLSLIEQDTSVLFWSAVLGGARARTRRDTVFWD